MKLTAKHKCRTAEIGLQKSPFLLPAAPVAALWAASALHVSIVFAAFLDLANGSTGGGITNSCQSLLVHVSLQAALPVLEGGAVGANGKNRGSWVGIAPARHAPCQQQG